MGAGTWEEEKEESKKLEEEIIWCNLGIKGKGLSLFSG